MKNKGINMSKLVSIIVAIFFIGFIGCAKEVIFDDLKSSEIIVNKAKLFIDVVLGKHQLTYEEALELWGEASEASFEYAILSGGIENLSLADYEFIMNKKHIIHKYSLMGLFIQETISKRIDTSNVRSLIIFYSVADEQLRLRGDQEDIFPEKLVTAKILILYDNGKSSIYIITLPFDVDDKIFMNMTFGNNFFLEAMGIYNDKNGKPIFSVKIANILSNLERKESLNLSEFRNIAQDK